MQPIKFNGKPVTIETSLDRFVRKINNLTVSNPDVASRCFDSDSVVIKKGKIIFSSESNLEILTKFPRNNERLS